MAMQAQDPEAGQAWADRMNAVREGCEAAVSALVRWRADPVTRSHRGGGLTLESTLRRALGTSAPSSGWTQARYIAVLQHTLLGTLVD